MKVIKAFSYALSGIRFCISQGFMMRLQLLIGSIVVAAALYFNISKMEWMVCIAAIFLVLAAEMFNTAMEQLCNLYSETYNPIVKTIKDVSAGAVLVLALAAALCGCIIFLPKLFS